MSNVNKQKSFCALTGHVLIWGKAGAGKTAHWFNDMSDVNALRQAIVDNPLLPDHFFKNTTGKIILPTPKH
ncbi:Uncharacterised protein [Edwardsiella tarda]|uniref:Uncharacterized protein n=1 Tax=Edwardsiella tarda ATCC 15947 = NBRC 105688 TaxID=667121 RepID=A0AC61TMM8_EDWTA|nr:hypothetical protein [Edwardsiella tarda]UAL58166.1 hypothetical protein K8O98_16905 [Edwardsiella tarda]UCQ01974.1 hypothetical protein DCL27_17510 [Edwardsiella tarda ATCC 15947 = NBRC 105688]STE53176.1 Uncharacterised protein [Edwardsiella tarda]